MGDQLFWERFIWFDAQIRRERYPNAARLARQFEVSGKTAQRSIEFFRDRIRAPLEYDDSRKGYAYRDPNFQMPVMRLSESELSAILISRQLLAEAAGPVSEELQSVSRKLGSLLAAHLPRRVSPADAFSFRWQGYSAADELHFRVVSDALLGSYLLSCCYASPRSGACTIRTVEPHHLVNYMGTWHLVAFCRLRQEWRDFVLSRMSLVRREEERFEPRPAAQWRPFLEDSFGIFQNREVFTVRIRFAPERARWVRGQVWHPQQQVAELEGGGLELTLPVSHEAEILMEVLSHGAGAEVLEPAWLRDKVAVEVAGMAERYRP